MKLKVISIGLASVMAIGMMSGCGKQMNYWKQAAAVQEWTTTETTGKIRFELNSGFVEKMVSEQLDNPEFSAMSGFFENGSTELLSIVNQLELNYTSQQSGTNTAVNYSIKNSAGKGIEGDVVKTRDGVYLGKNTYYSAVDMVKSFATSTLGILASMIDFDAYKFEIDKDYIMFMNGENMTDVNQLLELDFVSRLAEISDIYKSQLISKTGKNTYVLNMNTESLKADVTALMDAAEKDKETAGIIKAELDKIQKILALDATKAPEESKDEPAKDIDKQEILDGFFDDALFKEYSGSELISTLTKVDKNTYTTNSTIKVKYQNEDAYSVTIETTTVNKPDISVMTPTSVMNAEEFGNLFNNVASEMSSNTMNLFSDTPVELDEEADAEVVEMVKLMNFTNNANIPEETLKEFFTLRFANIDEAKEFINTYGYNVQGYIDTLEPEELESFKALVNSN